MKFLITTLLSMGLLAPAFATEPAEKPKTEMKLAKKKADKDKEAKEKKDKKSEEAKK
jgi:Na+-transporting methylmalonyl-CoA/oxaloacetate decarboxylase gamma subunit